MSRISRCLLVLVLTATLALASASFAGARPMETSQPADRTESGWFGAALKWLEDVAGLQFAAIGRHHRAASSPSSSQKDNNTPMGSSCIDPQGNPRPWCL